MSIVQLSDLMRNAPRYVLRGDYMENDYIQDLIPRRLAILVKDGQAYAEQAVGYEGFVNPLTISENSGEILTAARQSFSPDNGEIERVESAIGRQIFRRT